MTAVTNSTHKPYVKEQPKQEQPKKPKIKIYCNGRELKPENIGSPLTQDQVAQLSKIVDSAMETMKQSNVK